MDFAGLFRGLAAIDYAGPLTFESFSSAVVSPDLSNNLWVPPGMPSWRTDRMCSVSRGRLAALDMRMHLARRQAARTQLPWAAPAAAGACGATFGVTRQTWQRMHAASSTRSGVRHASRRRKLGAAGRLQVARHLPGFCLFATLQEAYATVAYAPPPAAYAVAKTCSSLVLMAVKMASMEHKYPLGGCKGAPGKPGCHGTAKKAHYRSRGTGVEAGNIRRRMG